MMKSKKQLMNCHFTIKNLYSGPEVSGQLPKPQHKYKSHNPYTKATTQIQKSWTRVPSVSAKYRVQLRR